MALWHFDSFCGIEYPFTGKRYIIYKEFSIPVNGGAALANIQLVKNMKTLRKKYNLTQQELADRLNISRQAYSNYETNKREPEMSIVIRFAELFHVSLDMLFLQTISPYDDDIIRERKGPYITATEADTKDTLYLTSREVDVILKYRQLTSDNKRLVDKILEN